MTPSPGIEPWPAEQALVFFCVFQASGVKREASAECESRAPPIARVSHFALSSRLSPLA